jgi:hypothetical protein
MCRNTLLGSRTRAGVVITVLLTSLAGIGSVGSQAAGVPSVTVTNAASFNQAVTKATTSTNIHLADGVYSGLVIKGHSAPLSIDGTANALVSNLQIQGSSAVMISGVTITPTGTVPARLVMSNSSGITVTGVHLNGRTEALGAIIQTDPTDVSIVIQNSDLTNCGSGGRCVAVGARNLVISHNTFHDCFDCDFVRGTAAGPTLINGNTFDRAVVGTCTGGVSSCNHNDHVQMLGGGPWTITGNTFGDRQQGAASVFAKTAFNNLTMPIHDVLIESNVFKGNAGYFAIQIDDDPGGAAAPKNISIINNTVLSGSASGLRLAAGWANVPLAARPFVANNVFALQKSQNSCAYGRFDSNLVVSGDKPCPGDSMGSANLDPTYHPTTASTLVISQADPTVAPPTDAVGKTRVGKPDRGAYESPY